MRRSRCSNILQLVPECLITTQWKMLRRDSHKFNGNICTKCFLHDRYWFPGSSGNNATFSTKIKPVLRSEDTAKPINQWIDGGTDQHIELSNSLTWYHELSYTEIHCVCSSFTEAAKWNESTWCHCAAGTFCDLNKRVFITCSVLTLITPIRWDQFTVILSIIGSLMQAAIDSSCFCLFLLYFSIS